MSIGAFLLADLSIILAIVAFSTSSTGTGADVPTTTVVGGDGPSDVEGGAHDGSDGATGSTTLPPDPAQSGRCGGLDVDFEEVSISFPASSTDNEVAREMARQIESAERLAAPARVGFMLTFTRGDVGRARQTSRAINALLVAENPAFQELELDVLTRDYWDGGTARTAARTELFLIIPCQGE